MSHWTDEKATPKPPSDPRLEWECLSNREGDAPPAPPRRLLAFRPACRV